MYIRPFVRGINDGFSQLSVVALDQNNNHCTTNPTLSGNDDKITLHSPSRSLNLPL